MKTNTPVTSSVDVSPVTTLRTRTPVTALLAEDLLDDGVPDELHLRVGERALLQDGAGAQRVAAVDHGHLRWRSA